MTPTRSEDAIELHSRQAALFADRYARMEQDRYATTFAYSRTRLDRLINDFLSGRRGGHVLDVGCGTGYQLQELSARGFAPEGVDGSVAMLRRAAELNPDIRLHQADVTDRLPFPPHTFDGAICIEVLRYLSQPQRCLSELARVLRPGAWCLFTATPLLNLNGYALVNLAARLLHVKGLVQTKQFFTTNRRIYRQLSDAGFDRIEVKGVYWGPTNWVERLAPGCLHGYLRRSERSDDWLTTRKWATPFANMILVSATRGS